MSWFDDEYGAGALEKFRAAAVVEPYVEAMLTEEAPGILRFRMSGPDGATGIIGVNWAVGMPVITWHSMDLRPTGGGTMSRLAVSFGPVLAEIGIEEMDIQGLHPSFRTIGFDERARCPVERLVEYSEWKRDERPMPAWRR